MRPPRCEHPAPPIGVPEVPAVLETKHMIHRRADLGRIVIASGSILDEGACNNDHEAKASASLGGDVVATQAAVVYRRSGACAVTEVQP